MTDIFNTREIAISIWIIIGLIWFITRSDGRKSLYHLANAIAHRQVVILYFVMLGGAQAYAEYDHRPDYKRVAKLIQGIFVAYGLIAISFSLHRIIGDYQEYFTTETFRKFLLPIVLLISFIPLYYAFALYSIYEVVLIQLKMPIRNNASLVRILKRRLFKYVGINLFKMERFCQYRHYAKPFFKEKEDIDRYFDWLAHKDIKKIVQKHKKLGIDELQWNAIIKVVLKNGTVVTGEYGHWTNAFKNEPKGESIYIVNSDEQKELYIDEIVEIVQIGNFSPQD